MPQLTKEKELEKRLAEMIENATSVREIFRSLRIESSTSDARTLYDLIGDHPFELLQDTSDYNLKEFRKFMYDVAHGMTPDLVIRSKRSGENRIYIELKLHRKLGYEIPLSQVVRQFLHLLGTSRCFDRSGIRRAVLLGGPSVWFEKQRNKEVWKYFLGHYTDLARLQKIDITLGELRLDALLDH